MPHILDAIIEHKRREVADAKLVTPAEYLRSQLESSRRDFKKAIAGGREDATPRLIAELKRKSPSEGVIRADFDFDATLATYQNFAAACSVLTDYRFFGGMLSDLADADAASEIPLLRKDFVIDAYQLLEARQFGADAVLLIAAILERDELQHLLDEAATLGMAALVEVHTASELEKVLTTSAEIIGVNNRNLDTLTVDLTTTHTLAKMMPKEKLIVAESGIATAADVANLAGVVDAILVGTSILKAENIEEKLRELTLR